MRLDVNMLVHYSQLGYHEDVELGCCEVSQKYVAGTTTQIECDQLTAGVNKWTAGVMCSQRKKSNLGLVTHNMFPCCYGLLGKCKLTTEYHCLFINGTLHMNEGIEHCSQVNCLSDICQMGGLESDPNLPYKPESAHQQWRYLTAIWLHPGLIYLLFICLV